MNKKLKNKLKKFKKINNKLKVNFTKNYKNYKNLRKNNKINHLNNKIFKKQFNQLLKV